MEKFIDPMISKIIQNNLDLFRKLKKNGITFNISVEYLNEGLYKIILIIEENDNFFIEQWSGDKNENVVFHNHGTIVLKFKNGKKIEGFFNTSIDDYPISDDLKKSLYNEFPELYGEEYPEIISEDLTDKIGQILTFAMQDQNLTWEQLKEKCGINPQQLQTVLRVGNTPRKDYRISTLLKVANCLGVEIKAFYKKISTDIFL